MSDLAVTVDLAARVPVVTVVGDVDHDTWPTLAVMLANVVHAGNEKAIVDLSGVEFIGPQRPHGVPGQREVRTDLPRCVAGEPAHHRLDAELRPLRSTAS